MFIKPCIVMTELRELLEALKIANQSDIIVAALGESAEMSGEVAAEQAIPFRKLKRITELLKTGKPVVLVLFTGRPLVLVQENESCSAEYLVCRSEAGSAIMTFCLGENPETDCYFSQCRSGTYLLQPKEYWKTLLNEEGNLKIQIQLYR
jgi:hypothetical protein